MNLEAIQAAAGIRLPIRHQLFIDGRFVDAESGETLATLNPHDNSTIAEVAMAGPADVDKAVAAATRAFPAWARMAAADRGWSYTQLVERILESAAQRYHLTASPARRTRAAQQQTGT